MSTTPTHTQTYTSDQATIHQIHPTPPPPFNKENSLFKKNDKIN